MSNEFGYIPESPEQSFGNNKGIFTPTDIYDLTRADKYTNFGQLELIQTEVISNATADFTNLQETTYQIHFFTFTDVHFGSQSEFGYRLSNDGGSSFETGYRFANQRLTEQGTSSPRKNTGQDSARLFGDISNNALSSGNGYMYLYNAGNSSKYTYSTSHSVFRDASDKCAMEYGSQLYDHTEQISAIRFGLGTSVSNLDSATISMYGIKEYS